MWLINFGLKVKINQMDQISFDQLNLLYFGQGKSVPEISKRLNCSENRVNYWIKKYKIKKRTISEAIYLKHNPNGDPFKFSWPKNFKESRLFGLGLGLYWGEGNKANKNAVRLGNSDVDLVRVWLEFLNVFFGITKDKLKFQLHIFSDIELSEAQNYWIKKLCLKKEQFYKSVVIKTGALGTYKKKSKYGVLTICYGNTKVRNILVNLLANVAQSVEHLHGKQKVRGSIPRVGSEMLQIHKK